MATSVVWQQHVTWDGVDYRPNDVGTVDDADAERLVRAHYARVATEPLPPTYPDPLPQYVTHAELGDGVGGDDFATTAEVDAARSDAIASATQYTDGKTWPASAIDSGVLGLARIPNLDAGRIPNLPASKITSGTFAPERIPELDAAKVTSGVLGAARIPGLQKLYAAVFTPEQYGAVGDGVADDSVPVQAAFTAAGDASGLVRGGALVVLAQSYRITRNLYGFGATTFEGPGELVVDADMSLSDGLAYWWNMGVKSKGGVRSTWTGRMSVRIRATVNAVYERTVNLHLVDGCVITRCSFDLTAMTTQGIEYPGGAITGYSNSAWCTDPSRRRVWITENRFTANQTAAIGSEGVGIHGNYVWILDNYLHGFGDDPIAIHACDHFVVRGNRCFSRDGRLIIRSSRWGVVADNHLERIANPNGTWASGGALLEFNLYDASEWHASTHVVVKDNHLRLPAGVTGPTYMMRAKGLRDSRVEGNEFHSDSPDTSVAALVVEAEPLPGWVDPLGVDVDGTARVRNLRVVGNYVSGSQPRGLAENGAGIVGPVRYSGNTFTNYQVYGPLSVLDPTNQVHGGSPDGLAAVDGRCIPQAELLLEADLTAAVGVLNKAKRNGVDRWYPRRRCIITAVEVEASAAVTAGYFTVQLRKNGGAAAATEDVPVDTNTPRGRRLTYYAGTNNRATAATDYFELVTEGVGLTPNPTQLRVRVFGLYTDLA